MADSATPQFNNFRDSGLIRAPIKATHNLIPGTFAMLDANGFALKAADTAAMKTGGLVIKGTGTAESSDNTSGNDGDIDVVLQTGNIVFIPAGSGYTPADSDFGDEVYFSDNNHVKKTATNYVVAGRVMEIGTVNGVAGVWVRQATPGEMDNISAVAALTDNSGGAAADGTIGAVTAPTALTDNGGGTADATVDSQAAPVTLTDSTGQSGTHDDTLAATTTMADLTGGEDPTEAEFNTLLAEVRVICQNASDTAQKVIELVTLAGTARNNLKELTTAQAANRLAIVALTDAVKELATKVNEIINA